MHYFHNHSIHFTLRFKGAKMTLICLLKWGMMSGGMKYEEEEGTVARKESLFPHVHQIKEIP